MANAKAGEVVSIRVNPLDCISVLDVLEKKGVSTVNMSFNQCVKIVLASTLETLRDLNYIPPPDGFTFLQRMAIFEDRKNRVSVLKITEGGNSPSFKAEPLFSDLEVKRRKIRFEELYFKFKSDPLNLTQEERDELKPLAEEFFV